MLLLLLLISIILTTRFRWFNDVMWCKTVLDNYDRSFKKKVCTEELISNFWQEYFCNCYNSMTEAICELTPDASINFEQVSINFEQLFFYLQTTLTNAQMITFIINIFCSLFIGTSSVNTITIALESCFCRQTLQMKI